MRYYISLAVMLLVVIGCAIVVVFSKEDALRIFFGIALCFSLIFLYAHIAD